MPDNNISKNQPSKAKGIGGVVKNRSKNAALLYMYRCIKENFDYIIQDDEEYKPMAVEFFKVTTINGHNEVHWKPVLFF